MRQIDVNISVIVPVGTRHASALELYAEYKAGLNALGKSYELIFVIDGRRDSFLSDLDRLARDGEEFTVITLTKSFGEATALMAGFEHASGKIIITLPAYHQIDAMELPTVIEALESSDMAVARRWPRSGGLIERLRRWSFHRLLGSVTRLQYHDLGCGVRAFDRRVLEEIQLYGDQHRFLAVIADRQGFKVREVDVRQSTSDRFEGLYGPRDYMRGFLDIFTVFFLVRFTKKPLRFFGMIGVTLFAAGAVLIAWMVIERLFFGQALAERPALLLSTLLVVLGLQLFALGLLGELIIFTHARSIKDYKVERVIHFPSNGDV